VTAHSEDWRLCRYLSLHRFDGTAWRTDRRFYESKDARSPYLLSRVKTDFLWRILLQNLNDASSGPRLANLRLCRTEQSLTADWPDAETLRDADPVKHHHHNGKCKRQSERLNTALTEKKTGANAIRLKTEWDKVAANFARRGGKSHSRSAMARQRQNGVWVWRTGDRHQWRYGDAAMVTLGIRDTVDEGGRHSGCSIPQSFAQNSHLSQHFTRKSTSSSVSNSLLPFASICS